jgi:hypothetical protein
MLNKNIKKNKLKYFSSVEFAKPLSPSSDNIPEWYRKIPNFAGKSPVIANNTKPNITVKTCMPFLDSMTTGYMINTWQDIQVIQDNGKALISWVMQPEPLIIRDKNINNLMPVPSGYEDTHFSWMSHLNYQTPKGISMIVTHPLNRFDLPFLTLSGIVDSEDGMVGGQIPFFIKKGFEGIIPKGTPFAQLIPFKKENWESQEDISLLKKGQEIKHLSNSVIKGWYKSSIWKKVHYK